ncbi:MAG TPA: hypothetical protein DIT85_00210 [Pantoea ananatis]|nr:hypothetical protein [Pantoea ananatis]
MFMVKSCFSKDNIHSRKTVKIGTLDEYRNTEHEQIVDKFEGTFRFNINLVDAHIDSGVFHFLQSSHNSFVKHYYHDMQMQGSSHVVDNSYFLKKFDMVIELQNTNRFIFCISHLKNVDDCIGIFEDYDDHWSFKASYTKLVTEELSASLNKEIMIRESAGIKVFEGEYEPEKLSFKVTIQKIDYKHRSMQIDNELFYRELTKIIEAFKGTSFIKPDSYAKEKEFRFIFDFYYQGKLLSPKSKSIIIPIEGRLLSLIK